MIYLNKGFVFAKYDPVVEKQGVLCDYFFIKSDWNNAIQEESKALSCWQQDIFFVSNKSSHADIQHTQQKFGFLRIMLHFCRNIISNRVVTYCWFHCIK